MSPPRYNLRSSRDSLPSCPKKLSKVTLGDRSFTYAAPKLWNALPLDIWSESTVAGLETKLKTHLFREAFFSRLNVILFIYTVILTYL